MCVGMKQVDVGIIIVQCLERDYILNKHYNAVSLLLLYLNMLNIDGIVFLYDRYPLIYM